MKGLSGGGYEKRDPRLGGVQAWKVKLCQGEEKKNHPLRRAVGCRGSAIEGKGESTRPEDPVTVKKTHSFRAGQKDRIGGRLRTK